MKFLIIFMKLFLTFCQGFLFNIKHFHHRPFHYEGRTRPPMEISTTFAPDHEENDTEMELNNAAFPKFKALLNSELLKDLLKLQLQILNDDQEKHMKFNPFGRIA